MRQVRLGIPHPQGNRHLSINPQRHQAFKSRMQAKTLIQAQHLIGGQCQFRPHLPIERITIRHHSVEAVIAAIQFHENQMPTPGRTDRHLRHEH